MKQKDKLLQNILDWIHQATKTVHGWIVLCGLLIGLCYFPVWLSFLTQRALKGAVSWFLILSMLMLAGIELWSRRNQLKKLEVSEEDQLLGHILILGSAILYPFSGFMLWTQALIWVFILIGIACSSWGIRFFKEFTLPTIFITLSSYPSLGDISRSLWELFIPDKALEKVMAWSGSMALNAIGRHATPDGVLIVLPEGAVQVGWGCNGLDMAITMTIAGLFMGLMLKQGRWQISAMMLSAAILALLANIPRIMLVTIAHVYWGERWFNFWHGFWGGQIFVGVLFNLYYYVVMSLVKKRHPRPSV